MNVKDKKWILSRSLKKLQKRMNEHSRLQGKLMKVSKYYSFKDR